MAQQNRLGKGNTTVSSEDKGVMVVTFHNTQIVKFTGREIILNSGGWKTSTTKTRMNQASNQFHLGYSVSQKNREWFVEFKGKRLEFKDNMTLRR
jgi:hypothetical protein